MPLNFDEIQDHDTWLESNPQYAPESIKNTQEEELGFWGTVGDIGMGVVRGVSGAVENTLEIGQVFGLDYDLFDTEDVFGESETMAGSAVESITQFAAGFIPGMWGLGHLGKIGKVAQTADKFSKTTRTYAKIAGASAIADATVFDAHEERLSNLIQEFPALQNPITEYLASDENDSEIEGRLKNAIEGLGIGFAIDGLLIGLRAMRKGVKHLPDKEAASKATQEETESLTREADEVTPVSDEGTPELDVVEDVKPVEEVEEILKPSPLKAPNKKLSDLTEEEIKSIDPHGYGIHQQKNGTFRVKRPSEFSEELMKELDPEGLGLVKLDNGSYRAKTDEEIIANFRKKTKAELTKLEKEQGGPVINVQTLSDDPRAQGVLRTVAAKSATLRAKALETLPDSEVADKVKEATEKLKDAGLLSPGDITKSEDVVALAASKSQEVRDASFFRIYLAEETDRIAQEMVPDVEDFIKNKGADGAAKFIYMQQVIENFMVAHKSVSSEFGRGLRLHQYKSDTAFAKTDNLSLKELLDDVNLRDQTIESRGGIDKLVAEAEKFLAASANGNYTKAIGQVRKKATLGGSLIEAWLNSILSGPTTTAVNALSAFLTTGVAPIEKALGATFRGDLRRAGRELKRYVYLAKASQDSIRLAHSVLKDNKAILDPMTSSVREGQYGPSQITNRLLETRLANSTAGVEAARWIGNIFNLPSRFLTAGDELFKQLNYRSSMEAGLVEQAIKSGVTDPKEISQYATDQMNRLIEDGQYLARKQFTKEARNNPEIAKITNGTQKAKAIGAYVEAEMKKYSPLAERALKQSQEVTFTDPLTRDRGHFINISRNISNAVNESPGLRLFFPFVRTPSNIIKYVMDRTPLALLNKQTRDSFNILNKELWSANAQVREDAAGRIMFGTSLMTTGYMLALNGNLTGGGPSDRNQQKILRDAGWQPYSIRVGDNYVSYRRLDPFSSFFGLMADVADAYQNADEVTREEVEGVGMALLMSVAKNLTDKTYLTGMTRLSNALSNPDRFAESMFNSTVASFVPFGGLMQQMNRSFEDEIKDIRGVLDGVAQKIPGWSDSVAPRRNMLGEPLKYQRAGIPVIDSISPFDYSKTSSDALKKEFAMIGHGFRPPRNIKNGVDLTQFESRSGQSAYDRWLELHGSVKIGGKTLKDSLSRLIRSRSYKKLPYESVEDLDKSPRVNAINRVVAKYRAKAFSQMLREFPEVQRRDEIGSLIRKNRRAGRDVSQLLALIEDQ